MVSKRNFSFNFFTCAYRFVAPKFVYDFEKVLIYLLLLFCSLYHILYWCFGWFWYDDLFFGGNDLDFLFWLMRFTWLIEWFELWLQNACYYIFISRRIVLSILHCCLLLFTFLTYSTFNTFIYDESYITLLLLPKAFSFSIIISMIRFFDDLLRIILDDKCFGAY